MSDYVNSVHPSSLLRLNGLFIEIAAGGNCLKTQQKSQFEDYKGISNCCLLKNVGKSN